MDGDDPAGEVLDLQLAEPGVLERAHALLAAAGWFEDAGFAELQVKDLAGGIVAVHRGFRR